MVSKSVLRSLLAEFVQEFFPFKRLIRCFEQMKCDALWQKLSVISKYYQVSRSSSVPPNTRDALYQGLPPSIKSALRSKLQTFQVKEEVTLFLAKNFFNNFLKLYV